VVAAAAEAARAAAPCWVTSWAAAAHSATMAAVKGPVAKAAEVRAAAVTELAAMAAGGQWPVATVASGSVQCGQPVRASGGGGGGTETD